MKVKLLFLFLAAFIIRLIALNQSLWLDEAITANVIKNYSYVHLVTQFSINDFHPPLHYELLKLWSSFFGTSEIALRFPSLFASLITGYFVFLIGKKLKNQAVGASAAALYLFNPLIVYYSQEARMYSLVTLFLTISFYCFLQKKSLFFNIFSSLALFTHYGAIFYLITIFLYLLFKKRYQIILTMVPGTIITLIVLSPLIIHQFLYATRALVNVTNWSLVLGKADLKNLILIPLKFVTGRISFYPKIAYFTISVTAALITFFVAFSSSSKLLKFIFITPLIFAFIISFNSPMFQYFRYLYLIPILSLLIASNNSHHFLKRFIFIIFLGFSLLYLSNQDYYREDWKSLSSALPANATVYMIPSFGDPIKYYRPDVNIVDIKKPPVSGSITVIPYGLSIYGLNQQQLLTGYQHLATLPYRQLTLELWQK